MNYSSTLAVFTVLLGSAAGALGVCGDAVPDAGEQCDVGALNGTAGACCSATCTFSPAGTSCTDPIPGDCTRVVCDGAGACVSGGDEPAGTACTITGPLEPCLAAECSGSVCGRPAAAGTPCMLASPNQCTLAQCNGAFTACGTVASGPCSDTTPGDCLQAVCQGRGTIGICFQPGVPQTPGTPCTDTAPSDCLAAQCAPGGVCNQAAAPQAAGAPCGSQTATECRLSDACDGTGGCAPRFAPSGTSCGDTAVGDCLSPRCDGSGTCDGVPAPLPAGTHCADAADDCFAATCDADGTCNQQGEAAPCPVPLLSGRALLLLFAVLLAVAAVAVRRSHSRYVEMRRRPR